MTEWQNHRILEGQGKSSVAPTFSKRGYKNGITQSENLQGQKLSKQSIVEGTIGDSYR